MWVITHMGDLDHPRRYDPIRGLDLGPDGVQIWTGSGYPISGSHPFRGSPDLGHLGTSDLTRSEEISATRIRQIRVWLISDHLELAYFNPLFHHIYTIHNNN